MKTKTLSVPGDKSISHRAIIFSALSHQTVRIENLLEGEDVLRTIAIFRKLGVSIQKRGKVWVVKGRGPSHLHPYKGVLYCGNSGTTMRLMLGVLAALPFKSELTGDASLNRRPMERVARPLCRMGAKIEEVYWNGKRIIRVKGPVIRGISYRLPVASAQLKSALLLAGMISGFKVTVKEPAQSRDHTERMIRLFRKKVKKLAIPGDPSSAAFLVVATLIHPNPKRLILKNVCINPTRIGFLKILKKMGGELRIQNQRTIYGERVGDIVVRPSPLKGLRIGGRIVPSLIDEVPILAVAAACAHGRSHFKDMEELRVKESDRIKALVTEFSKLGVSIRERRDGFEIRGLARLRGRRVKSYGDHRIAMSLAVLGTVASGRTVIDDVSCVRTSYPSFFKDLKRVTKFL